MAGPVPAIFWREKKMPASSTGMTTLVNYFFFPKKFFSIVANARW